MLQGFNVFVNIILKRFLTTAPSDSFFYLFWGGHPLFVRKVARIIYIFVTPWPHTK